MYVEQMGEAIYRYISTVRISSQFRTNIAKCQLLVDATALNNQILNALIYPYPIGVTEMTE